MQNIQNLCLSKTLTFSQNQFSPHHLPSSCASFSLAIMINLLLESMIIQGNELDHYLVKHGYKSAWFGIPSFQLSLALKGVSKYLVERIIPFPYQMEYCTHTRIEALIENLDRNIPTIIEVSWGTTKTVIHDLFTKGPASAVGHYLVHIGFNRQSNEFTFLDPGSGGFTHYSRDMLVKIWLMQPNIFVKRGSSIIFRSM